MESVSRPLIIALVGTVALLAIWLVALRPKPASVDNTPLAPTQVVPKANQAAAASDAANARTQAAANAADGSKPAPAAAAPAPAGPVPAPTKAAAPSKPSTAPADNAADAAVIRDIANGKVVVLLFWNASSADDVATRGAVRKLDRRDGKVAVHIAPISRVGRYESITQGITVAQSPTVVVIDRKRRARAIVGLTESSELKQAVSDALAGR